MARNMDHKFDAVDKKQYLLDERALVENPETRVPIIVCVDCSYSMRQEGRLARVTEGLAQFCDDMAKDQIARDSVDLCIISYGGKSAEVARNFTSPAQLLSEGLPELTADGETPLANAVSTAQEALARQLKRYSDNGISNYRPWLIIIGDGDESFDNEALRQAAAELKRESDAKHLNVLCVLVGNEANAPYASLMQLSPDSRVHYLRDLRFRAFFNWLSRSIQKTSQSLSGEEIQYEETETWADVIERGPQGGA